jgi:RimK family alpha-L-glutamate ligase
MRFAIVAQTATETNRALAAPRLAGVETALLTPARALAQLEPGDVALGRLDVLPSVDGVEPGLWALDELAARGVDVWNSVATLLASHDKLRTAAALTDARLPHPRTELLTCDAPPPPFELPVVIKPRFGSWGRDVMVCRTLGQLARCLETLRRRPWFQATGALVQELVPPRGHDLRLVVTRDRVVGAIRRVAAPGEWRTNVALGGRREPLVPPREARELALAAATAVGGALVGIDLLPAEDGFVVLEVNGAVEFTQAYSLGGDVFANTASLLARAPVVACAAWSLRNGDADPTRAGRLGVA